MELDAEEKLLAESLIAAAARHDLQAVKNLLKNVSANARDPETGFTPLHAVTAGCSPPVSNSVGAAQDSREAASNREEQSTVNVDPGTEDRAIEIARILFENGAIWNDVDTDDETAACIAWRLGLKRLYAIIVDAGVRAEILLNRLEELGEHEGTNEDAGSDSSGDDDKESGVEQKGQSLEEPHNSEPEDLQKSPPAAGASDSHNPPINYIDHWDSNSAFLRSSLRFTPTQLLDSSSNAVMMDWEKELMGRHAESLLPRPGLRALNIGHGMGIVDTAIQTHRPEVHHIVEAHPAVLSKMKENGWLNKPGVKVHEGRWQDVLPRLVEEGVEVDAIYYDTFAEDYKDFKDLFSEHVIGLLEQSGRFGFYHGLGADRRVCYDVYTSVAEMDLLEAGFKTKWEELAVPEIEWKGVRRPYWNVDVYRLPTCTYL